MIDNRTVELVRKQPLPAAFSQLLPADAGIVLLPEVQHFSPLDWVLVVFNMDASKRKAEFAIMAGKSDSMQVLPLTHDGCATSKDQAACWREVEDNWSIMLGSEAKNYEITGVTLFRNVGRESMFVQEVEGLAGGARHATIDEDVGASSNLPLKRQVT